MIRKILPILSLLVIFQSQATIAADDALDEVNRYRASRGLQPFARDPQLSKAAAACADYRAARLMAGHTHSDFSFLPSGANAEAAGCAAWPVGMGWGSCCSSENWRYGGAAYSIGRDGKRYMHLFVSNTPNAAPQPRYHWQRVEKGWWYVKDNQYVGFLHDNRIFQWRAADGSYSEGQRLEAGEFPEE